jgi:uncharacterized membrane protein
MCHLAGTQQLRKQSGYTSHVDFSDGQLPVFILWSAWILYGFVAFVAVRFSPWARLRDNEVLHVFLGACVALMVLWIIRVNVRSDLHLHLLGVTTFTLMFGWPLAVVAVSLVAFGVSFSGVGGIETFALNVLLTGVIPIVLTTVLLSVTQRRLPHNFFIYVYLNAFLAAGLSILSAMLAGAIILVAGDARSFGWLADQYLPYLPMMFFSEAVLNGMVMTMLVALRPAWVYSFDDKLYIHGK